MIKLQKKDTNKIINCIQNNELIILKTDTVYGIMAKANSKNELAINQFKKSDQYKKVSIIFDSVNTLIESIDNLTSEKITIIKEKLPGKYTFIVNLKKDLVTSLGFNRTDFGVRVTNNEYLQNIIKVTGPLLASSCNLTGYEPCSTIEEIEEQFKDTDINVVIDTKANKISSTIVDLTSDEIKILR